MSLGFGKRTQPGIRHAFVRRCHELLLTGQSLLKPAELGDLHEEVITELLVKAMRDYLASGSCPRWAERLQVHEEQPVSVDSKSGKERPVIDISLQDGRSNSYLFEAKRLGSKHSVSDYLGEDGMLALITGYYGALPRAGMIGYAQTHTCADWYAKIKSQIEAEPARYKVKNKQPLSPLASSSELKDILVSTHQHAGNDCLITHTVLLAH